MNLPVAVFLAPMAGISDLPFRNLALRLGAVAVVSEMVASEDVVRARSSARARAALGADDGRTVVQIAGREARWMAEAAKLCAGQGARAIDINFGCPARRVTGGLSGAALMRDPDRALRLIEAVVAAVDVPVTVKMRLGWDDATINAPEIAARAEAAGIARLTVHGRTRCQFYRGRADWAAIGAVSATVGVPVIVNGDITDPGTAETALRRSRAGGVMVGRGARGRPWILGDIAARLTGRKPPPAPGGAELRDLIRGHYEAMLEFHGRELGARVARKHLGWYLDAAGCPAAQKRAVLVEADPARVGHLLSSLEFGEALQELGQAA